MRPRGRWWMLDGRAGSRATEDAPSTAGRPRRGCGCGGTRPTAHGRRRTIHVRGMTRTCVGSYGNLCSACESEYSSGNWPRDHVRSSGSSVSLLPVSAGSGDLIGEQCTADVWTPRPKPPKNERSWVERRNLEHHECARFRMTNNRVARSRPGIGRRRRRGSAYSYKLYQLFSSRYNTV